MTDNFYLEAENGYLTEINKILANSSFTTNIIIFNY